MRKIALLGILFTMVSVVSFQQDVSAADVWVSNNPVYTEDYSTGKFYPIDNVSLYVVEDSITKYDSKKGVFFHVKYVYEKGSLPNQERVWNVIVKNGVPYQRQSIKTAKDETWTSATEIGNKGRAVKVWDFVKTKINIK